jgi:integrase
MVVTAARPAEALAAKWSEIDWEKKHWRNPVSKLDKPLDVPLAAAALALLDQQQKIRSVSSTPRWGRRALSPGLKKWPSNRHGGPRRPDVPPAQDPISGDADDLNQFRWPADGRLPLIQSAC